MVAILDILSSQPAQPGHQRTCDCQTSLAPALLSLHMRDIRTETLNFIPPQMNTDEHNCVCLAALSRAFNNFGP